MVEIGPYPDEHTGNSEEKTQEVFLSDSERMGLVKHYLRKVIEIVSTSETDDEQQIRALINPFIEEIMEHVNAKPAQFNVREQSLITILSLRNDSSSKFIALWCSQLLGAVNERTRYPARWEELPRNIKRAFVSNLKERLEQYLDDESLENLYKIEELAAGFLFSYFDCIDSEVAKICKGLNETIKNKLANEDLLLKVRLRLYLVKITAMHIAMERHIE